MTGRPTGSRLDPRREGPRRGATALEQRSHSADGQRRAGDLNALKPELPLTQFAGNDGMFIVEDLPNGDRLSELLRSFLLSYVLGMLVRYHPSRWIALLRNEKGDAAQPCLKAVTRAIAADFPRQVVEALS